MLLTRRIFQSSSTSIAWSHHPAYALTVVCLALGCAEREEPAAYVVSVPDALADAGDSQCMPASTADPVAGIWSQLDGCGFTYEFHDGYYRMDSTGVKVCSGYTLEPGDMPEERWRLDSPFGDEIVPRENCDGVVVPVTHYPDVSTMFLEWPDGEHLDLYLEVEGGEPVLQWERVGCGSKKSLEDFCLGLSSGRP